MGLWASVLAARRFELKSVGGEISAARGRAMPPPPPRWGRTPGASGPSGPLHRGQSRGPHGLSPFLGGAVELVLRISASPPVHFGSAQWRRRRSTSACAFWFGLSSPPDACRSRRSCTPLATRRLGVRYRLAASSAPSPPPSRRQPFRPDEVFSSPTPYSMSRGHAEPAFAALRSRTRTTHW
jgi:hypothetical protein